MTQIEEHPLRQKLYAMPAWKRPRLWQLSAVSGMNESRLSRALRGIEPMPDTAAKAIEKALKKVS